jgi:hypothetical protein
MNSQNLFRPLAKAAFEIKKILESIEKEKESYPTKIFKRQKKSLKFLLNTSLRLTGDFIPVGVSKKALEYCCKNSLGDIFSIGWEDQAKFEKQKNRNTCQLKHEHKIPINQLVDLILKAKNEEEILEIFLKQEIVWILKSEDSKLPKNKRVDSSYLDAEIEIIKNPNEPGHLFL